MFIECELRNLAVTNEDDDDAYRAVILDSNQIVSVSRMTEFDRGRCGMCRCDRTNAIVVTKDGKEHFSTHCLYYFRRYLLNGGE